MRLAPGKAWATEAVVGVTFTEALKVSVAPAVGGCPVPCAAQN